MVEAQTVYKRLPRSPYGKLAMTGAAGADKTYKLGTGDPTKIKLIRLGRKQDALT